METVAAILARNVAMLRGRRQLSVRDLAALLTKQGMRMLPSAVSKIENGQRKVTVDELVALAVALDVSPVRLLLPGEPEEEIALPGDDRAWPWQTAWRWAVGEQPLTWEPIPVTDRRVKMFVQEDRPFENPSHAREVTRWLVAREPVPFTAHIEADASGRAKGRITPG